MDPSSQWCGTLVQKFFHKQNLVILIVQQASLFVHQIAWLHWHFGFSVLAFLALLADGQFV